MTRAGLPRPEGDQKTPPRKEEYSTILIHNIEDGDGSGLVVGRIDLGGLPQMLRFKAHGDVVITVSPLMKLGLGRCKDGKRCLHSRRADERRLLKGNGLVFPGNGEYVRSYMEQEPEKGYPTSPVILR